jgi:hypothetical protein
VFISWGGNRSLHVATALHEALQQMMDAARPWRSDEGIRTGEAWFPAIMAALQEAEIGIVCLTPESLPKPWLNFEAGAIAGKVRNRSLVMTVRAAGVTTKDVEPPLSMYQGGDVEDEKFMLKLFEDVSTAIGANVPTVKLQDRFKEYVWPKLKAKIKEMPEPEEDVPPHRKPDAVMGEILDLVRGIRADVAPRRPSKMESLLRTWYPNDDWIANSAGQDVLVLRPEPVDPLAAAAHSRGVARFAKQLADEVAAKMNDGPTTLVKSLSKKKADE